MRHALTLASLLATLALPAVAQDAAPRYAMDMSVMKGGVEIASARTIIVEGGQAEVLLSGADGQYNLRADLQLEQGDGAEGRLSLEAFLSHDGADLAKPMLTIKRGGSATIQIGAGDAALSDGVQIEVSPLPAA